MTGPRLRECLLRLIGVVRPARSDADLEAEIRSHLALAAEAERARGAPDAPEGADRRAILRAGGVDQAMEAVRDQRGVPLLRDLNRDVREATRLFTRTPAVAAVAVVSIALSLALGVTVLRVANAYVLRALPYPNADRLYSLILEAPDQPFVRGADLLPWHTLEDIAEHRISWDLDMFFLLGGEYPEPAPGAWVTQGFIGGLGVRVAHGRSLAPSDFAPAGPIPVLISHRLWTARFGGASDVLGRPLRAYVSDRPDEAETFVVVGVLDPGFWHINTYTDILAPLRSPQVPYMLTLRAGADPALAAGRIRSLVAEGLPNLTGGWRLELQSVQARYLTGVAPLLSAVASAAGLVILIACANVAVLLLVRAVRRHHEMALRLALGASRLRLARLHVIEGWLLAAVSTALAAVLSSALLAAGAETVERYVGRRLPGGASALALDSTLLAGLLLAALLVTAVLTLIPLAGAALPTLAPGLVSAGRATSGGRTAGRMRAALVTLEVAGALTLLVGAALMVDSTRRLVNEDPGMRGDVIVAEIGLRARSYQTPDQRAAFFERLLRAIEDRTGSRAAMGAMFPLQSARAATVASEDERRSTARAAITLVSAGYFDVLGIPLRDGASFDTEDRPGGTPAAVVSERLAARLWPDGRAVGRNVRVPVVDENGAFESRTMVYRVAGVAADVRQLSVSGPAIARDEEPFELYLPLLQRARRFAFLCVPERAFGRADADALLRRVIAGVDPEAAVAPPRTVQAAMDAFQIRPRRLAWLLSLLAGVATLVALVGVYGVLAYAVRQREREIGVRLAVGAAPVQIVRLFLGEGGRLLAAGLAAGGAGAVMLGRGLETQLFGVRPVEPSLLVAAIAALAICGAAACWWPARRAARVGPAQVLRSE